MLPKARHHMSELRMSHHKRNQGSYIPKVEINIEENYQPYKEVTPRDSLTD